MPVPVFGPLLDNGWKAQLNKREKEFQIQRIPNSKGFQIPLGNRGKSTKGVDGWAHLLLEISLRSDMLSSICIKEK